jgi:hypothetical protein
MAQPTLKSRRGFSKFIRHPEQYPLQIKTRDLKILDLIRDYRFIPSDHVTTLIGGSSRKVLERLQKLFHHCYLDRLYDRRIRTHAGSEKMVYAITSKAADILADELGLDLTKVNWTWKNRAVTERHIKHTLMIAKFRAALTLAAKQQENLKLAFWRENRGSGKSIDPDLCDTVTLQYGKGREEQRRIVPDAFLALMEPDHQNYLYLEADRSTMTNERFEKKLRAYWTWKKQGGSALKHGVRHFRVLTVTRSYERRDNLRKAALKATPVKGGSAMFWFACEKDYSVDNPASILGPIWVTAKDNTPHRLFE